MIFAYSQPGEHEVSRNDDEERNGKWREKKEGGEGEGLKGSPSVKSMYKHIQ